MQTARLNWIYYARGIAIILVTYRHVFEGMKESGLAVGDYPFLEYANIFFYSFRMPLFFIISGIFVALSVQKRGVKKFIDTRARSVLWPYFLWGFIQLTLQMAFSRYTNGQPTPGSYLNLFYLPREIAQFWYLYALFNVSVLYVFSRFVLKINPYYNLVIGLIFFYFSSIVYQQSINIWFLSDILHYYIFFAIGDCVSRFLLDKNNYRFFESGRMLLIMIVPFLLAQSYFLWQNLRQQISKYMFVEYYQPFAFLVIALTGGLFIISLTFYLQKKNILKWLPELGVQSLYIYVAHVIVFAGVRIVLTNFVGIQNVFIILFACMLSGILVPLLLYKLAVKMNMRWLFTLEKLKTPVSSNASTLTQVLKS